MGNEICGHSNTHKRRCDRSLRQVAKLFVRVCQAFLMVSLTPYGRHTIGGDTKHTSLYFKADNVVTDGCYHNFTFNTKYGEVIFRCLDDFTSKCFMFGYFVMLMKALCSPRLFI